MSLAIRLQTYLYTGIAFACLCSQASAQVDLPTLADPLPPPIPMDLGRPQGTPTPQGTPQSTDIRTRPMMDRGLSGKRIERIQGLISTLKDYAAKRKEQEKQAATTAEPQPAPVQPPVAPTVTPPKQQPTLPAKTDTKVIAITTPLAPIPPKDTPEAKTTDEATEEETSPIPISMTTTVDSLALANNLFSQGEIGQALPIYENLSKGVHENSSTHAWIQYQLACCYRKQGSIPKAKQLYRIVGSNADDQYWASRAQWWLNHISHAEEISTRQKQLEKKLTELREMLDGLKQN